MTWYEEEVKALEKKLTQYTAEPGTIFYGSSSIRLWETMDTDFAGYNPVNIGFGGSTLAACVWFFDRLIAPVPAKRIIFYAGDNDLGDGRNPEEIFIFFQQLMARVKNRFGDIPFAFISVKPSIARWAINDKIKYTNELIGGEIKKHANASYIDIYKQMTDASGFPRRDMFMPDGLHLSPAGYTLWRTSVLAYLQST